MRIAIDIQACQSSSRGRGIGRFSLALTQAMIRAGGGHEFWLLLNDHFADTIAELRGEFDGLLPQDRIKLFGPERSRRPWDRWRGRAATPTRDAVLAEIGPDLVHISSLFEGRDVISSVGAGGIPTTVTLYDLIPLAHAARYLAERTGLMEGAWYYAKIEELKRADLLLAISEHSRREAIDRLGLPEDRIVHCGIGIDERFRPLDLSPARQEEVRRRFGLHRPFIMYTGGIDWRKNMAGLIEAFALLPPAPRSRHALAIVCAVRKEERRALLALASRLGLGAQDVVLTGFVPDAELIALYNLCELFVFPSLHEGFGLPVAEAMACGAAVLGANTTSIPEVIGRADALFDPTEPVAIAAAIATTLGDPELLQSLRRHGPLRTRQYTWETAAARALDALEAVAARRRDPAAALGGDLVAI